MLSLKIKDIRDVLTDTLFENYALADFAVRGTKTTKDKEFRIEFRIYDSEFWVSVDTAIDSIRVCSRSLGGPDRLDSIQMWLTKPFEYDKSKFEFGWRTDLERFFDDFHAALLEKVKKTQKTNASSVYGSSTKVDEPKSVLAQCIDAVYGNSAETKTKEVATSIFNGLDDQEDRDEYI